MTSDARGDRDSRSGGRDGGPRRGGGGGGGRDRDGGGGRFRRPRGCEFCRSKVDVVDYKNVQMLRRYITDGAKMEARRKVGTCAKHQRVVSQAIKRARQVALLPYTSEHIRLSGQGSGRR
ncbi:MAG: 30S ribosomal protein S18 [Chloroflexi bacterium]|nr:30S ribosomal protein S18 [Chloroflexota bacterium]MQC48056.1 30S ribosomal protein S18 [Chloroflexota bacterium]